MRCRRPHAVSCLQLKRRFTRLFTVGRR
jgi:hypothetical protein